MVRSKISGLYKGLYVLLTVGFVSGGVLHICASSTSDKLHEAQKEYNQMQQQIDQGKDDLEALEGEKQQITGQLEDYNTQLSQAVYALNDTEQQIDEKQQQIDEKQQQIDQKLKELDTAKKIEEKQYEDLIFHMQFMYESGLTQSYLNMASEATSFAEFINISEYVEQISAYDMKMLTQFQETRAFIETEEAELEQQYAQLEVEYTELETLKAQQEKKRDQVNALVDQAKSALNNKQGEITQKENELTAQEEQLATIGDNIAELQKKLAEELALSQEAAKAEWRDISQITFDEGDLTMLANLIYCEARGESYDGKLAVGSVVVNRILSSKFPDTMAGVIYQSGQFAPVTSTKNSFVEALAYDKAANVAGCYQAAQEAMSGVTNVENCVFFQTLGYLEKVQRLDMVRFTLGNHGFY